MGNTQGFINAYSVPMQGTQENQSTTPIFRAATHPDALVETFCDEVCFTCWDLFRRGKSLNFGKNPCLGYRERSPDTGTPAQAFTWLSYNDVEKAALALGTGLLRMKNGCMDPITYEDEEYQYGRTLRVIGIFSKNRIEWFTCEQAANAYNFTLVPLYDTLGDAALKLVLERTRMRTVLCSVERFSRLLECTDDNNTYLRTIVVMVDPHEQIPEDLLARCAKVGIEVIAYNTLIDSVRGNFCPIQPSGIDGINTICYTSGTTGNPKGVILTHRNIVSCVSAFIRGPVAVGGFALQSTDTYISYLPLAHVLERAVSNIVLAVGGSIGLYSGDTLKLIDDIQLLKPTVFISVPRLFNRLNDVVFRNVLDKGFLARYLFGKGISTKLAHRRQNAATTSRLWDPLVFHKTRQLMGGRLRYMISGGAPLDALVHEHVEILFSAPLIEGYGLTETFGPAFVASVHDPVAGHIGGPVPCVEFKLESVPEMSYNVSDCPPRGEILVRGHSVTVGYFRDPEETRKAIDKDGWFHTGDIGVMLHGQSLKIVDRKKNIFKLAQGEYIAPEKLEVIYSKATLVSQAFVFGYSEKNALVAIVVPDEAVLELHVKKAFPTLVGCPLEKLCQRSEIVNAVMEEMDRVACDAQLTGFEKVKRIYLEPNPFTLENGILTPTYKIKRHHAKQVFQKQIDEMYASLE